MRASLSYRVATRRKPAEHALDAVALAVGIAIVRDRRPSAGGGRDDCLGAPLGEHEAEGVGIICLVGHQARDWTGLGKQGSGQCAVVDVPRRQQEHARAALFVGQGVDLGRAPAARAPDRLDEVPPFAPAAERWALIWVASTAAVP